MTDKPTPCEFERWFLSGKKRLGKNNSWRLNFLPTHYPDWRPAKVEGTSSQITTQLQPSHIPDPQVTMAEQLIQRGTLEGHSGWVTSLATSLEKSVH